MVPDRAILTMADSRPDLRGTGARAPGLPRSHRQRASHQTLHILFLAHDSCLRNCDLVLMHACVKHASARLASFIDQVIASLDQRLQFYVNKRI